jgi:damage control phosphatase ARMT1-like protein
MHARGGDARRLADRLRAEAEVGRLALAPDPFWSTPRFLHEAPPHVAEALAGATIAIFKGDANYRRICGDAIWDPASPFASACEYLRAPLVALRTMKSDPVLGLAPGTAERLDSEDPRWRIDGRSGVIQAFIPPGDTAEREE